MFENLKTWLFAGTVVVLLAALPVCFYVGQQYGKAACERDDADELTRAQSAVIADLLIKSDKAKAGQVSLQRTNDHLANRIGELEHEARKADVPVSVCAISDGEQRLLDDQLQAYRDAHAARLRELYGSVP